jgi:hypothetical protein
MAPGSIRYLESDMSRLVKVKITLPDGDHLIANRVCPADVSGQWVPKLLGMSPILRSVGMDRTFERGGFTLTIDDVDGDYQALMAVDGTRKIYGYAVTAYIYAADESAVEKTISATIYDWSRDAGKFILKCVQEFAGKLATVPSSTVLRITLTDWPNAQVKSVGQIVPMPSGTVWKDHGGQWAYRVLHPSTSNVPFVASWSDPGGDSRIITVDNVYIDGVELDSSKWSYARDVNGWEIITITSLKVPVPWRISCNVTARTPLSASGNPVPYLNEILDDAGVSLVDDGLGGSSDFEDFCTTNSWAIVGNTPDSITTIREYLETWCHNFDCFWTIDAAGAVHIKHFDWSSITADAALSEQHFDFLREDSQMAEFANRLRCKFNYDPSESVWVNEIAVDSTAGDYLPGTMPVEKPDEYCMFAYTAGASHPVTDKIKFIDHPAYVITATIPLELYVMFSLDLLKVATISHYNLIGTSGKYLIMRETADYIGGNVGIVARRLWGA